MLKRFWMMKRVFRSKILFEKELAKIVNGRADTPNGRALCRPCSPIDQRHLLRRKILLATRVGARLDPYGPLYSFSKSL